MGKTTTPKYVVDLFHVGIQSTTAAWRGRATVKRLREYVDGYNNSIKPGGVNYRVGEVFGALAAVAKTGVIYTNDSERREVARYSVPTFTW